MNALINARLDLLVGWLVPHGGGQGSISSREAIRGSRGAMT